MKLQRLYCRSAELTDDGVAQLAKLPLLQELEIDGNPIRGEGLAYLKVLDNLTKLDLGRTQQFENP